MILIRTNAGNVAREFNLTAKQLEKAGPRIIKRIVQSNANALRYQAGLIAFKGDLRKSIYQRVYKNSGAVMTLNNEQAVALELGPQAIGINPSTGKTVWLSNSNPKLKEWAKSRLGKSRGKVTIGKEPNTKFGKPSHKFITNARSGMRQREERIVIDELKRLKRGGK